MASPSISPTWAKHMELWNGVIYTAIRRPAFPIVQLGCVTKEDEYFFLQCSRVKLGPVGENAAKRGVSWDVVLITHL